MKNLLNTNLVSISSKLVVSVIVLVLLSINVFSITTRIVEPEVTYLEAGQVYTIQGTSDKEMIREAEKEKIAPYIAIGFLIVFLL